MLQYPYSYVTQKNHTNMRYSLCMGMCHYLKLLYKFLDHGFLTGEP